MLLFAYGSLMYEPELPLSVTAAYPARLAGYHRVFNKRSRGRGCPAAFAPAVPAVPGFDRGGDRQSLVLGTASGGHIDGLALEYPERMAPELLPAMERREGRGYVRTSVEIVVGGERRSALTWLTRPGTDLLVDLELVAQAQVLVAATPRADVDGRARGAHYLLRTLDALEAMKAWDPRMEALGELVRRGVDPGGDAGYS